MRKEKQNKKIKSYHPTKRDIKKYIPKAINSLEDKKQQTTKEGVKGGEYLKTYIRHLERRLRDLETEKQLLDAERLRFEQELHSLRSYTKDLEKRLRTLQTEKTRLEKELQEFRGD